MSLNQYRDDLDTWPNLFRANFRTLDQEEVDFWDLHVQRRFQDLREGEISRAIQTMSEKKAEGIKRYEWPTLEILLQTIQENRKKWRSRETGKQAKSRRRDPTGREDYWKHGGTEPNLEDWKEAVAMMREHHIKLFFPEHYERFKKVEPIAPDEED